VVDVGTGAKKCANNVISSVHGVVISLRIRLGDFSDGFGEYFVIHVDLYVYNLANV